MDQGKKVKDEIGANGLLQMLVQTYQEHAIEQINFARSSVLTSREFAQQLQEVFVNVKTSYASFIQTILERDKKKNFGENKNGKEALVLITSNNKLYGDIIPKIDELFLNNLQKSKADIVLIGRRGKDFLEQMGVDRAYQYFDVPDDHFTIELLKPVITYLLPYNKVTVFHGQFINILSQDAISDNVSGDTLGEEQKKPTQEKQDFLFEPSLEAVLAFFENQIFSVLFNQSMHEAQLARYASRIKAMETAHNNLEERLKVLKQQARRLRAMQINKKQLQLLAGKSLWGSGARK